MPITREQVAAAMEGLRAQGKNITIDGIREALGGTGSKTTIQRFRKQLDAEAGTDAPPRTLSEELSQLVSGMAERLRAEADIRIQDVIRACEEKEANLEMHLQETRSVLKARETDLKHLRTRLETVEQARDVAEASCAELTTRNARLDADIQGRDREIAANQAAMQSLEEKHSQAREALNHYRESVKAQREQDLRRHDQQLQQLQQDIRQKEQLLGQLQGQLSAAGNRESRLTGQMEQMNHSLARQETINTGLEQRLQQAEQRIKEQQDQLASAAMKENRQKMAVDNLERELERQAEQYIQRARQQEQKLQRLAQAEQSLQTQLQASEKLCIELQAKLVTQQSLLDQLRPARQQETFSG